VTASVAALAVEGFSAGACFQTLMPFTLSHSVAVVPFVRLSRGRLPLSALVIGSMSPDFEYFLRGRAVSEFSHTLPGLVLFCLPTGLVTFWLFQHFIKRPALLLFPDSVRARTHGISTPAALLPFGRLSVVVASVLIGAVTHVAWDSLTHDYGGVVKAIPALRATLLTFRGVDMKTYNILQHCSSALGLGLLIYYCARWLRQQPLLIDPADGYLPKGIRYFVSAALVSVTLIVGLSFGARAASPYGGVRAFQIFAVQSAVAGMAVFAISLLIFGLLFRAFGTSLTSRTRRQ
jgi:hypothetical protein